MNFAELLPALQDLPRADKFRALQFLSADLAREEQPELINGADYPVWTPHEAGDAATILTRYLAKPTDSL